ncbi:MAG: polysaccharide biosynthesis protein, partial [Actinobacteria bacterium]|nr:polysaccharide biosynthesis protein [Actinomycetota bacterium]
FQSQLRAYLDVIPRILYVVLRFAITLVLLAMGVPWWALFLAWVIAYAAADVLALVLFRVKTHLSWRPQLRGTGRLVREALTLGVAGFLGMATVQWGTLYLGFTGEPEKVAVFNTAILPIQYLSMFASVIAIVAFPLVSSAWARRDRAAFGRIDGAARTAILALFLPVAVLLFEAPLHDVMEKVFGKGYGAAAQPMRLMSIALILASMMVWAGFVFLAVGHLRAIIAINGLCLLVGIVTAPLVVPAWGIDGLGAVGIAATGVGITTAAILLRRGTPAGFDGRGTVRVLICGALLWAALSAVSRVTDSFLALAAVTAVVYPALVVVLRVLRSDVIDDLRAGTTAREDPVPSGLAGGGAE